MDQTQFIFIIAFILSLFLWNRQEKKAEQKKHDAYMRIIHLDKMNKIKKELNK